MTTTCPPDHDVCDECRMVGGSHAEWCRHLRLRDVRRDIESLQARVARLESIVLRFERATQDDGR